MKTYSTYAIYDIETGKLLCRDEIPYASQWMLCDRSLAKKAGQAADTAKAVGSSEGANAAEVGANLIPGLESEAKTPQGYTPVEMSHQLVAGEQGAGGATSGITGEGKLTAMRTRNAAGVPAALDEAERIKGRQLSQNALDVANKSADLGQKKQMFAQGELGNIYGLDKNAMLRAMGLVPEDVNAAANAEKTGWVQNFTDIMKSLQGAGAKGVTL